MDPRRFTLHEGTTETARHFLVDERSVLLDWRIRLSNNIVLLAVRCQIIDMLGYSSFVDPAIRRFDKSELVNPSKSAHRADQSDVRSFRGLTRTDTSVVRRMNVTDFESCTIPAQTTWAKSRKAALMGQFRQRIGLIHELAEL